MLLHEGAANIKLLLHADGHGFNKPERPGYHRLFLQHLMSYATITADLRLRLRLRVRPRPGPVTCEKHFIFI